MNLDFFIEEEQYIQCSPLELDSFISYCKKRGINITKNQLEFLEKKKLFFPTLRIKRPKYREKIERVSNNQIKLLGPLKHRERYKGETRERYSTIEFEKEYLTFLKKNRYISIPRNQKFVPWKIYFNSQLKEKSTIIYYSQFQIFWLYELLQWSNIKFGFMFFDKVSKKNAWEKIKTGKKLLKSFATKFQTKTDDYYKLTEILIAIQNMYYPYTKTDGRKISVSFPLTHYEWDWHKFKKSWDPIKIQKALNFDSAYLKKWYEKIILAAEYIDPLTHWFTFIQFFSYEKKKKLNGTALLAQDFYAIAKMLKMYYEDLTGKRFAVSNERYFNWNKQYYGDKTINNKLELLEYLSNEYHLNPRPKLILVVEGEGEYENIPKIANAMGLDFNLSAIRLENLKGIGNFRKSESFIDHYHDLQTVVYVLLDNENNTRQFKNKILRKKSKYGISRKITKSDYIKIWDNNFEFDNFTNEEIARVMTKQCQQKYIFKEKEVNIARNRLKKIEDIYKEKVKVGLNKRELAKDLSDILIKEIQKEKNAIPLRKKRKIINEIIEITEIALKNYFPTHKDLWKKNQESGFFGDVILRK